MKSISIALTLTLLTSIALAGGSHSNRGYIRKNGSYVAPSHATNPDRTKTNNYSQKGNINPYSGKRGVKQ
jgi:hypothetical protein